MYNGQVLWRLSGARSAISQPIQVKDVTDRTIIESQLNGDVEPLYE
jgi:hypothetical protein